MSAEPMSGSNPDEMDEEKGGMASRGMEEEKAELMLRVRDVIF